jgi:radical SAM protein with 4Fe4S-binding SPASM domain
VALIDDDGTPAAVPSTPSNADAATPGALEGPGLYRRKRSAVAAFAEHAQRAGSAISAMVEVADRCNEACVHCYQVQGQKGELETEQWKSIFEELAELGVMFLTISGGEPTLRKDFLELVAHARKLRFAVKVYSNALNITREVAQELGRLAVQEVQISLYSQRAEVHDAVTRVPGSFEKVVAATRALHAAGVRVLLKTPMLKQNSAEFREYADFVASLGADYALDPNLSPREDGDLGPTRFAAGKAELFAVRRDARFASAKKMPLREPGRKDPCGACKSNVHIEPNGELRPCTQWAIPTGNSLQGLREAWENDPTAAAIRSLGWNDLPACRVCDLREYCQRCFAKSEQYTGSALAPYEKACRGARWRYELHHGIEPEIDAAEGHCPSVPLGPFRSAGEHRFLVDPSNSDTSSHAAPHVDRSWLPGDVRRTEPTSSSVGQLVQIRRHKSAPLTPATLPPSDQ